MYIHHKQEELVSCDIYSALEYFSGSLR